MIADFSFNETIGMLEFNSNIEQSHHELFFPSSSPTLSPTTNNNPLITENVYWFIIGALSCTVLVLACSPCLLAFHSAFCSLNAPINPETRSPV